VPKVGQFLIRAAWRTDYEDVGWEEELKGRIREGLVDRGHHPLGDFSVELIEGDPTNDVVKFYTTSVEVAGDGEGWMDLSRMTVKRPVVAGPEPEWVGLLDENKREIQEDWYGRVSRKEGDADFELPENASPCPVSYVGEYLESEGGAALRIYPVDAGGRPFVLEPDSIFSV
jgi:hypothetical protein